MEITIHLSDREVEAIQVAGKRSDAAYDEAFELAVINRVLGQYGVALEVRQQIRNLSK